MNECTWAPPAVYWEFKKKNDEGSTFYETVYIVYGNSYDGVLAVQMWNTQQQQSCCHRICLYANGCKATDT